MNTKWTWSEFKVNMKWNRSESHKNVQKMSKKCPKNTNVEVEVGEVTLNENEVKVKWKL
jgi:hypothetical protein